MKKLIYLLSLLTFLNFSSCKEKKMAASDVPQAVVNEFQAKYPNSSDIKWEEEKEDGKVLYQAEFKYNGKEMKAEFDAAGNFIKEE